MKKKLLIRADGNANIGAGHIMRCLSIANAAKKIGIDICFVTADESFLQVLDEQNFRVRVLDSDYKKMDNELSKIIPIVEMEKPDGIILDSYFVTKSYMNYLKKTAKLIYIDDVLAFPYPVDTLINYNIYASKKQYTKLYAQVNAPNMLLGSEYVPLRDEFQNGKVIEIKSKVKNILFSAGGADPERIALRFVKSVITKRELNDILFHIVLGSFEPDRNEIESISTVHNNIITHSNVRRMSDLMLQCDLAVSAAGSTLYELCACGVPTITYVLADNQMPGAKAFSDLGIMENVGDDRFDKGLINNIISLIEDLDYDKRKLMQHNMKKCIDGKGAYKMIKELNII